MAKKQIKKIRLKRAKEDKAIKGQLKKDIAQFLVDMHFCISLNTEEALVDLLKNGSKGYFKMRNKDLISNLEEAYEILNRPLKQRIKFGAYVYNKESLKNTGGGRYYDFSGSRSDTELQSETHDEFKSRAEGLVGQVLDAIIGLEREEAAGGSPSAKAYKRGLPDADLNEPWCDF